MCDYILTVAVSVSSGVAAISSAIPSMASAAVPIGVGVIALLLYGNLRGVRQAGRLFAIPTYGFIVGMLVLIAVGLVDAAGDNFVAHRPSAVATEGVTFLLILRAFGSGATAMTGIEAISDGGARLPARRVAQRAHDAHVDGGLLVTMFAGTTLLAHFQGVVPTGTETHAVPARRTPPSAADRCTRTSRPRPRAHPAAGRQHRLQRLPAAPVLLARDGFAPKAFLRMGDRLAFSNGIVALAVVAIVLYVAFDGNTERLIPLYAVGVFLAFTLSQSAMVVRWWRRRDRGWQHSLVANSVGAFLSAIVLLVEAGTKFTEGAWLVVVLVPTLMAMAWVIRIHYRRVHRATR
jgi:amino acid transporter